MYATNSRGTGERSIAIRELCPEILLAILLAILPLANAQDAPATVLETVTVTAQKRSENLMTVPVSVNVLSADALESSGIGNTGDLKLVTPGLVYDELDGFPLYYIRGVGTDFTQPGVSSAVAIYSDGIYQNFSQSSTQGLLDVERIEVLKGPQGTLYGRNSTAGAINIITRRPSTEALEAEFSAGVGNYGRQSLQAYLSGPWTERVAASVAGFYEQRDSFVRNGFTGRRLDDREAYGARAKVLGRFGEGAEAEVAAWYFNSVDDAAGAFQQLQATATGAVFGPLIGGGRLSDDRELVYNDFPVNWSNRQAGAHVKVRVPFESFDLVSLTGYQDWLARSGVDFDATDAPIAFFFSDSKTQTASQELQLVSTRGDVEWVAGVFYYDNKGAFAPLNVPAGTSPPLRVNGPLTVIRTEARAQASAVFAQASYRFGAGDAWRVTAGGRYSREKATLEPATIAVTGIGVVARIPGTDETWDDFSPKLTLDYSTDNSLTFLTVSRGFKSGAYNLASPGDLSPVQPEKLTAIEFGYKLTFAGGRARFELAAFNYDYKQLQVQFITNQTAPLTLGNAKKATSRGVELSLTGKATPNLQLTAGLALLPEATYDSFGTTLPGGAVINGGVAYTDNGAGNSSGIANFSGNDLAHAPSTSGNLGIVYERPFAGGSIVLSGNLYHSGKYYFSAQNSPRARQDAYTTLNARVTWKSADERWRVAIWGNNLTDETYYTQILVNALGSLAQFAPQRTTGVEFGYSIR